MTSILDLSILARQDLLANRSQVYKERNPRTALSYGLRSSDLLVDKTEARSAEGNHAPNLSGAQAAADKSLLYKPQNRSGQVTSGQ
jgi:hypothetical protein